MGEYSSLVLTPTTIVFKGAGEDKTIELGTVTIDAMSPQFVDFIIRGTDTSLWFGPAGNAKYHAVVVKKDSAEEYIPITVGLILDAKKALESKSTVKEGESVEVGTVKGSARRLRLNVQRRRTQRNGRHHKRTKAKNLASRRR